MKKRPQKKNKRHSQGFDRGINPFDGSRRRLSSSEHKDKTKYSRKIKHRNERRDD